MYLNDNQYFYVYLYRGKSQMGYTHVYNYMFHARKSIPKKIYIFFSNVYCTKKSPKMFFFKYVYTRAFRG